jgi:erythromycin esterase-like protein
MSSDPIVQWAQSAGVRLDWPSDGRPDRELSQLDDLFSGAEVVFLGETDHFTHEKSDFRLLVCRHLLERGWRAFAEELAWSDGRRLAGYLASGDERALDRLSLFGWTGEARPDRDDRPTGLLRASFDAYPTELMRAEQTRFYRGLKAAAGAAALGYYGLDIDALPGGGYADIAETLAPWSDHPLVRAFAAALTRRPGESAKAESARLAALAPAAEQLAVEIDPALDIVAPDLAALAESLAYVEITYGARSYDALRPGMAYREACMKRRFADVRRLTGGAPLVVMGHALHLATDDRRLGAAPGVGPGGGQEPSLGHHIVQTLGLKPASIWLIHGAGEDSQPFPDLPRRFAYPKATLNARLSVFSEPVLFPVTGAPEGLFAGPVGVGHMYNVVQPAVLAGLVDWILFLPRVTPMRLA